MDVPTFRSNFPEFDNTTRYPDAIIAMWISVGCKMLNSGRWYDLLEHGLGLFTAHHVSIQGQILKDVAVGGQAGQNKGPVTQKTIDKVSISYDSGAAIDEGASHWNLTTYGTQFIRLAKMMGAGGAQVGTSGLNAGVVVPFGGFWA